MPFCCRVLLVLLLVPLVGAIRKLHAAADIEPIVTGKAAAELFVYQGKPIHPFCINFPFDSDPAVKMQSCAGSRVEVRRHDDWLEADFPHDSGAILRQPFASYRVLAKKGTEFLIATTTSGGGSGIFDSLFWVAIDGNTLRVTTRVTGGDRCGGGLESDYRFENNFLLFSQHVTPIDILKLASGDNSKTSLEGSASSCFGRAHYEYDIANNKRKLVSITLAYDLDSNNASGEVTDRPGWTEEYADQSCFNKVYNHYIASKKAELSNAQLTSFGHDFMTTCISQPR